MLIFNNSFYTHKSQVDGGEISIRRRPISSATCRSEIGGHPTARRRPMYGCTNQHNIFVFWRPEDVSDVRPDISRHVSDDCQMTDVGTDFKCELKSSGDSEKGLSVY